MATSAPLLPSSLPYSPSSSSPLLRASAQTRYLVGDPQCLQQGFRRRGEIARAPLPIRVSSENSASTITSPTASSPSSSELGFKDHRQRSGDSVDSAADVVRAFYAGINCRNLASVEPLIAENCVYEDLIFPHPFRGRKAILNFFHKFNESISKDLQFVIDDMTEEDPSSIGVTWHLEWQRKTFPFSKGCSFYRLEVSGGKRHIVYGRDSVEPFFKPGEAALVAIRGVTWLLKSFPQLANQL